MKFLAAAILALTYGKKNKPDKLDQYGMVKGDPHFIVKSKNGDPVCFDFQPPTGTNFNLLIDPESALSVSATAEMGDNGKSFMQSIHFASPNGARLEFDRNGIHLGRVVENEKILTARSRQPKEYDGKFDDMIFSQHFGESGIHQRTRIQIENGPLFMVTGNTEKNSLSISVLETDGISRKAKGLIGHFLKDDAYLITDIQLDTATIKISNYKSESTVNVHKETFHGERSCWVIPSDDIANILTKNVDF